MQVEIRNNTLDWTRLQRATDGMVEAAAGQSGIQRPNSTFRAEVPQYAVSVDRVKAATLQVKIQDVFDTLSAYLGSSYAGQFDRFGRTFQVFAEAEGDARTTQAQVSRLRVRNAQNDMIPLGSLVAMTPVAGPSLVSLYDLYPSASILGSPAAGFSSGDAIDLMQQAAARTLLPGTGYDWTAMSYQEQAVGNQIYYLFGLALLLVYFVLATQYESWWMPLSVLLAIPLALVGPVLVITALGIDNNLYTQIGLILLVALSAKNAILIVEMARESRRAGADILEAAVHGAVTRFRPILMTSIAFSLGVVPLVLASGASANARKSIGITTLSGMISSTLLAVVLVPAYFALAQRFDEYLAARKAKSAAAGSRRLVETK